MLLLQVIPPIYVTLNVIVIPQLFDVTNSSLLGFFVLMPAAWRMRRDADLPRIRGLNAMDRFLLGYGLLTSIYWVLPEASPGVLIPTTATNDLRHAFVFISMTYLPYYAITRCLTDRDALREAMAALCLSCALMAGMAIYESASTWLLYGDIANRWGYGLKLSLYLMRGGGVRAMASAGHALVLGYILAVAFGFWLYLQSATASRLYRLGFFGLIWAGLFASFSRGAWLGTVAIYFLYAAFGPKPFARIFKASAFAVLVVGIVSLTPLGDRVTEYLPFLGGTADAGTYTYRQQLIDRSWQIIQASPWLGDQEALLKMEDLRQGEGIIDIVNTYVSILLDNGFVGLALFMGFTLLGLLKAVALSRRVVSSDEDLSRLGASLIAVIAGTLFMLVDNNMGMGVERVFYVLIAFAAVYDHLGQRSARERFSPYRLATATKGRPARQ
jgi:O-antigen ligase